ncbi:MAG: hypothetical protein SGI84_06935 [Gemmatimonadota bacterium]|nr:hypothetical protein [Gemmatimonadota bacterium]
MALGPDFQVHRDDHDIHRIRYGATAVVSTPAIFRVEGPGALTCLQGLLTNDLDTPGPGSLVYGALLTPKGMIILDLWSIRDETGFLLVAPEQSRDTALQLFKRSLPPRLARVTDLTGQWVAAWLLGELTAEKLPLAGLGEFPLPGEARLVSTDAGAVHLACGTPTAWFRGLLIGSTDAVATARARLAAVGAVLGTGDDLETARVLAGWPTLDREIGEKTLPQEVAFDELGGVSYTKGCYTGQETVARVHFRGHPNRELRGLVWDDLSALTSEAVIAAGKEVGQFTSLVVTPTRRFGLAVLRREILPGQPVMAGGQAATVVALPLSPDPLAA